MIVPQAQAGWSPADVELVHQWNQQADSFDDPLVATAWGYAKNSMRYRGTLFGMTADSTIFPTDGYRLNLRVLWRPARNGDKVPFKAPLYVLLPGVFGDVDDPDLGGFYARLQQQKVHILVPPNPLSEDALLHLPTAPPGDIVSEGKVMLQVIQAAIQSIGRENVDGIHILGVSYGSLLAAVTAGLAEDSPGIRFDSVTVIHPPLEGMNSFLRLDALAAENRNASCSDFDEFWASVHFLVAARQSDLSAQNIECAHSMVVSTFVDGLTQMIQIGVRAFPQALGTLNRDSFPSFAKYLAAFPRAAERYRDSELGSLSYWVSKIEAAQPGILQILSSEDDFLNTPHDWDELRTRLSNPDSELLLTRWGGHMGFLGHERFLDPFASADGEGSAAR